MILGLFPWKDWHARKLLNLNHILCQFSININANWHNDSNLHYDEMLFFFWLRFVHVKLPLSEFSVCSWLVCITHYTGLMSFASTLKSEPICNPFPWAQWYMKEVSLLFFKPIFLNVHKFFYFYFWLILYFVRL